MLFRTIKQGLFDVSAVEFVLITPGVGHVGGVVDGKIVVAGKIFFGAHVEIIVLWRVEDSVDGFFRSNANRSGGQSGVDVGA